jgi:hypothetical protein
MSAEGPLLEVVGYGAVSPAGCSAAALWQEPVPAPTFEALLSQPHRQIPVRRINPQQGALARWQKEPRLRRANPLAIFITEAADQALMSSPELARDRVGLVCALSTGSIIYSRKFFTQMQARGRHLASPILFPETVYNSPVSHLAAVLNITRANYTLMGDESAWVDALRVAQVWLARRTVDAVLVVGGEELDILALEAFDLAGWIRRGLVATEGAGAIVVRAAAKPTSESCVLKVSPTSIPFRSPREQKAAWWSFYQRSTTDLPLVVTKSMAPSTSWGQFVKSTQARELERDWGFAFTASASWSFLQAMHHRKSNAPFTLLVPGSNAAVSAVSFI